jgi:NAD-dependent deacetylase
MAPGLHQGMIYERIVILTGAGISADSGVDTFRDPDGVWSQYDWQEVATPEGFARNPAMVHDFYNMRRAGLAEVAPNAAHAALARLERDSEAEVLVVTQNVDDLHERAGTTNIIHMHGEMKKVRCQCDGHVLAWHTDLSVDTPCPQCGKPGCLRPHVVWFGEMPFSMDRIAQALADCDLFVSIGTSGNVYPAAGFVAEVRAAGHAHTAEINLEPSQGHSHFEEKVYGRAVDTVPPFVARLLG